VPPFQVVFCILFAEGLGGAFFRKLGDDSQILWYPIVCDRWCIPICSKLTSSMIRNSC